MANKPKRKPAGAVTQRKKSVFKASAAKGREDSRAAQIKREKFERIATAQNDPPALAEVYQEREHDVDRHRKVKRFEKRKKKER